MRWMKLNVLRFVCDDTEKEATLRLKGGKINEVNIY